MKNGGEGEIKGKIGRKQGEIVGELRRTLGGTLGVSIWSECQLKLAIIW